LPDLATEFRPGKPCRLYGLEGLQLANVPDMARLGLRGTSIAGCFAAIGFRGWTMEKSKRESLRTAGKDPRLTFKDESWPGSSVQTWRFTPPRFWR
jgi:hypothetical protein